MPNLQQRILRCLIDGAGEWTSLEMAEYLKVDPVDVLARLTELARMRKVVRAGLAPRKPGTRGRTPILWKHAEQGETK